MDAGRLWFVDEYITRSMRMSSLSTFGLSLSEYRTHQLSSRATHTHKSLVLHPRPHLPSTPTFQTHLHLTNLLYNGRSQISPLGRLDRPPLPHPSRPRLHQWRQERRVHRLGFDLPQGSSALQGSQRRDRAGELLEVSVASLTIAGH